MTEKILRWAAVTALAAVGAVWFLWGFVESFVEHWHFGAIEFDFAMMIARYLVPMLLLAAFLLLVTRPPRHRTHHRRTAARTGH